MAVNTKTDPGKYVVAGFSPRVVRFPHFFRPGGRHMKRLVAAATLLLSVFLVNAIAQTTNATLGGIVSDASRALIPGVTVTATNTQTGIVTTVVTNETGAYQFASLQTGLYKVAAELPGFQTQVYSEVTLGVAQQVRLNFTLQVGTQSQQVEV